MARWPVTFQKEEGYLQLGDQGKSVWRLQRRLVKAGYHVGDQAAKGKPSGVFGKSTKHAVQVFQIEAGFKGHGKVGRKTIRALGVAASIGARYRRWKKGRGKPTLRVVDYTLTQRLPWHRTKRWNARRTSTIDAIVIHHTGGMGSIQSDNAFHTKSNYVTKGGAPHLCYHFWIHRNGTVYQANNYTNIVWHCGARNKDTVGISCQGVNPTKAQRHVLPQLIKLTQKQCPGTRPKSRVLGHMEVKSTSCPGSILMKWVRNYRK